MGSGDVVHHSALIHSIDSECTHNPNTGRPERLKSDGNDQSSMDVMNKSGIEYTVIRTFEDGVRVGNVPIHKYKCKQKGTARAVSQVLDNSRYR